MKDWKKHKVSDWDVSMVKVAVKEFAGQRPSAVMQKLNVSGPVLSVLVGDEKHLERLVKPADATKIIAFMKPILQQEEQKRREEEEEKRREEEEKRREADRERRAEDEQKRREEEKKRRESNRIANTRSIKVLVESEMKIDGSEIPDEEGKFTRLINVTISSDAAFSQLFNSLGGLPLLYNKEKKEFEVKASLHNLENNMIYIVDPSKSMITKLQKFEAQLQQHEGAISNREKSLEKTVGAVSDTFYGFA